MKKVDVCLSPEMIRVYDISEKIVVVVDVLRATTCITTALAHSVESITPVATIDECQHLQHKGYIAAAERGGQKVDGFDLGNSPFSYMDDNLKHKKVALTTTNGTRAIDLSREARQVIIGSFLNLTAVVDYLKSRNEDVLIFCAGWKGRFNLEDTLYAGALVERLLDSHELENDAPLAALNLYENMKGDLLGALQKSSHVQRLSKYGILEDVKFSLKEDLYTVIPVLKGDELVRMEPVTA